MKILKTFEKFNNSSIINEDYSSENLKKDIIKFVDDNYKKYFNDIEVVELESNLDDKGYGNKTIQVRFHYTNSINEYNDEEIFKQLKKTKISYNKSFGNKFKNYYDKGIRGVIDTFKKENKIINIDTLSCVYVEKLVDYKNNWNPGERMVVLYNSDGTKTEIDTPESFTKKNPDIILNHEYVYINISVDIF